MPDINVWIALASDRHVHHNAASVWFDDVESEGAVFCRVTQMGMLRLLTNSHVMGTDVVTQKEAWQIYQQLSRDHRIIFLNEPSDIEHEWQQLTQGDSASTNTWTDAYLAAFASIRGLKVVSFDSDFKKLLGSNVMIL
ncbi:MAG TPA: TA system VapC family ribonuclease toxin [Verrucomicrobiae bacterium]